MRSPPFNHISLLRFTGMFTFAWSGVPLLSSTWRAPEITTGSPEYVGWFVAYAIFGVAYWFATHDLGRRQPALQRIPLLVVMNVAAFAIGWFSHSGISGILFMLIAGVVPWTLPLIPGIVWVMLQNYTLVPIFIEWLEWDGVAAFVQSSLYMGFSAFTYVTSLVAKQQADSRDELRRLNSELRATRTLLTESSRIAERMRISRDLHDLVGHHLTALSLNLEVASHLVSGTAQDHVRQAQSVAKLLLSDVREVVSQLRENDTIDLTEALKTLVEGVPGLAIHLDMPPRFSVDDPLRAQVLLRCAQEIITNTVRHSGARNLWLRCERTDSNELAIHARDDGRGAGQMQQGNGLTGMRERLAQVGGRLDIVTARDAGFALDAWLPLEANR
ncbi:MAG TPA: sensor histidine kinase [Rudaea sp.]|jgi:signal transduction histidine kinase|nr:sensor histidine kinase [Rudaea sp.]